MIVAVRGPLQAQGADYLVVEVGGIGLRIWVPPSVAVKHSTIGDEVLLHTHLHVRENELTLYGFPALAELSIFQLLISVSGIGPKVALNLLDGVQPATLQRAVAHDLPELLTHVPGIGKKTAKRLILELKGKFPDTEFGGEAVPSPADTEAISALTALGYSITEARQAVQSLPDRQNLSLDEVILNALRQLGQ
ncbi:MAG: Holliday junction branch migration protein RuvA [Chloroflexi bacterium]|nr:Holliday junction branch migration protein RuvA [Chloroflexota bacterium]